MHPAWLPTWHQGEATWWSALSQLWQIYLACLGGLLWKTVNFWQFKGWLSSLELSISLYSTTFPSCWTNVKVSWLLNISTMRREKWKWWYCTQSNCLLCGTIDHYNHFRSSNMRKFFLDVMVGKKLSVLGENTLFSFLLIKLCSLYFHLFPWVLAGLPLFVVLSSSFV